MCPPMGHHAVLAGTLPQFLHLAASQSEELNLGQILWTIRGSGPRDAQTACTARLCCCRSWYRSAWLRQLPVGLAECAGACGMGGNQQNVTL